MQELVDKLKENSILGVEVKANLSISPGKSGTIITKDKKVYDVFNEDYINLKSKLILNPYKYLIIKN